MPPADRKTAKGTAKRLASAALSGVLAGGLAGALYLGVTPAPADAATRCQTGATVSAGRQAHLDATGVAWAREVRRTRVTCTRGTATTLRWVQTYGPWERDTTVGSVP